MNVSRLLLLTALSGVTLAAVSAHALPYVKKSAFSSDDRIVQVADSSTEAAMNFIDTLAEDALKFLADNNLSKAQKITYFRKLLNERFDLRTIARFALGKYWRTATPEQQATYTDLFEKMIVDVYADRFDNYGGQTLKIDGARVDGNDVLVRSEITANPPITVDWRVRSKNGGYKVVDVIIEGVSMGLTQRSDFSAVIQRGGGDIDVLLNHLRSGAAAKAAQKAIDKG